MCLVVVVFVVVVDVIVVIVIVCGNCGDGVGDVGSCDGGGVVFGGGDDGGIVIVMTAVQPVVICACIHARLNFTIAKTPYILGFRSPF